MAEVKTQKIILKRSSVAGKIPTADQLDPGELAINLADGLLTSKDTSDNIIDLNSFDRKMGFSNDSSKGEITSTDSIKTALSKIENNIIDNEKVVSESLNDLNTSKVNKSSVTVSNPTLSWGTESTIGTVDNKSFKVTMPSNPNTDTKVTSSANHYTPVSETYTPATGSAVAWGGSVITGITKDSKGHITGVTTGTIPSSPTVTDTKYTFANGTNGSFTVTPSGGSPQTVTVGKPSTAGTADKVSNSLSLKVNSGTTEGTNLYTFNGSSAKVLDIKAGSNVTLTAAAGSVTISSTNTTYGVATTSSNGLMSSSDKTKLDGIDTGANNYVHPTTSGNKHIPSGGSSGQILRWSADGTAVWGADTDTNTTYTFTGGTNSFQVTPSGGSAQVVAVTPSVSNLSTSRTISLTGAVTGSVSTDLSSNASIATTLAGFDASKITSGTISIDRLPKGALERLSIVANTAARLALTSSDVQNGDTVKQTDTGIMYYVKDDTKLSTEAGWEPYTAGTATSVPWSGITGKPSTFTPADHTHTKSQITDFPATWSWNNISDKPSSYTPSSHTQSYTTLTGSTTIANQAIVSSGTANGWTLKTLGSNAFNSTAIPTTYAGSSSAGGAATTALACTGNSATATTASKTTGTLTINGTAFNGSSNVTINTPNTNTTYTFTGGTDKFTVTPSGGTAQDVAIDVSVSNSAPTLTWGGTSTIGTVSGTELTVKMPANPNTDTHWTSQLRTTTSATGTTTAAATNPFLNLVENGDIRDSHQIVGSGATTVTSDANGKITISSTNTDTNTTYTFANGTNGFTVTPSGGSAQTVTVTPSIANNVTGSGTSGYLTKFNGANTVTNGPALGSSTTTFLRNDGTWATPASNVNTSNASDGVYRNVIASDVNGTTRSTNKVTTSMSGNVTSLRVGNYEDTGDDLNALTLYHYSGSKCQITSEGLPIEIYSNFGNIKVGTDMSNNTNGKLEVSAGEIELNTEGAWASNPIAKIMLATKYNDSDSNEYNFLKLGINCSGGTSTSDYTYIEFGGKDKSLTVPGRVNSPEGFFQTSDIRLKENISDIDIKLSDIEKIPTVRFNYKSDTSKSIQIGTIADEVENLFPEVVSKDNNGYKIVDYTKLSVLAIGAIKQLNKKIDNLIEKLGINI